MAQSAPEKSTDGILQNLEEIYIANRNLKNNAISKLLNENMLHARSPAFYGVVFDINVVNRAFYTLLQFTEKTKRKDLCTLTAIVFCKICLILLEHGVGVSKANTFFSTHISSINKVAVENDMVRTLIENKEEFISCELDLQVAKKFFVSTNTICITRASYELLRQFLLDTKGYFILTEIVEQCIQLQCEESPAEHDDALNMAQSPRIRNAEGFNADALDTSKLQNIINEFNMAVSLPIDVIELKNVSEKVDCGLVRRSCGLIAYSQQNRVHLKSINCMDPILQYNYLSELVLYQHSARVSCICMTPENDFLISSSYDGALNVYDMKQQDKSPALRFVFEGHVGPIYQCCASSNGAYVASAGHDTTARLWGLAEGKCLRIFVGHTGAVTCLSFHPNTLYLCTGSKDGRLKLWSLHSGDCVRTFMLSNSTRKYSIALHPLGELVASAGEDRILRIWQISDTKCLINQIIGDFGCITRLCWSQNGKQLCIASVNGWVQIWQLNNETKSASTNECDISIRFISGYKLKANESIHDLEYCFDTFSILVGTYDHESN